MTDTRTWAELLASLPASSVEHVQRTAAEAGPFPDDTRAVLRDVFNGAGERILARQQGQPAA